MGVARERDAVSFSHTLVLITVLYYLPLISGCYLLFVFPVLLLCALQRRFSPRATPLLVITATLVSWILLNIHHMATFTIPLEHFGRTHEWDEIFQRILQKDCEAFGVFFSGWVPQLLVILAWIFTRSILRIIWRLARSGGHDDAGASQAKT